MIASRRRFLGGVLCAGAACLCRSEEGFSIRLTRTKTGLAVVPVYVGRNQLSLAVDTGATSSIIAEEALARLTPDDYQERGSLSVLLATGRMRARSIALSSVALPGSAAVPLDVAAIKLGRYRELFGDAIDGVLGMDFLVSYGLRFDLRAQKLDMLAGALLQAPDTVQFELANQRKILFPAYVGGREVTALLDTAATLTVVNWKAAEQAGINRNSPGLRQRNTIIGVDGAVWPFHEYRFDVQVGRVVWDRRPLNIGDLTLFEGMGLADKPAAILGIDLLDGRVAAISFADSRLWIG